MNPKLAPNTFEQAWWESVSESDPADKEYQRLTESTLLDLCLTAAYQIGDLARTARFDLEGLQPEIKPRSGEVPESPVTKYDRLAEQLLRQSIADSFGDQVNVVGEEYGGELDPNPEVYNVVIDPIDGTKSFLAHENGFSVAISIFKGTQLIAGIITNPIQEEMYYGFQDHPSRVIQLPTRPTQIIQAQNLPTNSTPNPDLRVNLNVVKIDESLLATVANINEATREITDIRGLGGSPALNIAEASKGFYVYLYNWKYGETEPHDLAAGVKIIHNAGGSVIGENGEPINPIGHRGILIAGTHQANQARVLQIVQSVSS